MLPVYSSPFTLFRNPEIHVHFPGILRYLNARRGELTATARIHVTRMKREEREEDTWACRGQRSLTGDQEVITG